MLELTLEFGEYLQVDTQAWLDDRSTVDDELTDSLVSFLQSRDASYADADSVTAWLETLGPVSGVYGEDGPASVATCNEESFLSTDISFVFAHAGERALIVETGTGYFLHSPAYVVVRTFEGYDDSEAFGYSSGWLSHDEQTDCSAELILEHAGYLVWRNGGGNTWKLEELVTPADDETDTPAAIRCPDCGGRMTGFTD